MRTPQPPPLRKLYLADALPEFAKIQAARWRTERPAVGLLGEPGTPVSRQGPVKSQQQGTSPWMRG